MNLIYSSEGSLGTYFGGSILKYSYTIEKRSWTVHFFMSLNLGVYTVI
jgi:hypothetical protein